MSITNRLIRPMVKMSDGMIKKRWFARLQFKQLHIKEELFDAYYADACKIKRENMIAFLENNSFYKLKDSLNRCTAKVMIAVGEREGRKMRKSAELLHGILP